MEARERQAGTAARPPHMLTHARVAPALVLANGERRLKPSHATLIKGFLSFSHFPS